MDSQHLLRKSALFVDLNEEEIGALGRIAKLQKVAKGNVLFLEGDRATGFFVLLSGGMRIYKASPEAKEYVLHLVHPGQVFAEAAIFKGNTYPANCMATEDSQVAFFPKDDFMRLVQTSPQIALKMIASLSSWLREFTRKLEDLSLKEVSARLASFILAESEKSSGSFDLTVSKTQLASQLGTVIETLSRNLKRMRDLGVIAVVGRRIEVLDPDRLKLIADGEKI